MDEMFFYESRQPVFDNNDEIRYKVKTKPKQKKINSKRNAVACGVAIVLTIFLVGIGLGYWSCNLQKAIVDTDGSDEEKRTTQIFGRHEDIAAQIDRREIEKHLRFARNIDLIYNRTIDTEHNYVQSSRKRLKKGGGGVSHTICRQHKIGFRKLSYIWVHVQNFSKQLCNANFSWFLQLGEL